jgi:hypothetical protein
MGRPRTTAAALVSAPRKRYAAPVSARESRPTRLAAAGLALGLTAVLGYFLVVFRLGAWLPGVRNHALPNWVVIIAGLALSVRAGTRLRAGQRLLAGLLITLNLALAGAFAALLYVMSAVPAAAGPTLGVAAPDFALSDQRGHTTRLADFRGRPLLLVFYRGYW